MRAIRNWIVGGSVGLIAAAALSVQAAPPPAAPQLPSRMPPQQLTMMLTNSAYPFQRERAANELAKLDWHANREAVQVLMTAAQRDPAPNVRAACIRALTCMRCDTAPVLSVIQMSRNDCDARVQHAADVALAEFRPGNASKGNSEIRQAGYTAPGRQPAPAVQQTGFFKSPDLPELEQALHIPDNSSGKAAGKSTTITSSR